MNLDELFTPQPRASQCRFAREYNALEPDDRAKLETAFANPEITTAWIYNVLSQNGFTSSESTVRTHRKGQCRTCGKLA